MGVTTLERHASPHELLREFRGQIVDACLGYRRVLHVEVRDSEGRIWRLVTQGSDWSPKETSDLVGRSIERSDLDEASGALR